MRKGKLIKSEYISRKRGELVKVTRMWKINRAFQHTLTFILKQPRLSTVISRRCIGIVTIFTSQLI